MNRDDDCGGGFRNSRYAGGDALPGIVANKMFSIHSLCIFCASMILGGSYDVQSDNCDYHTYCFLKPLCGVFCFCESYVRL
ncbi:MAG: hypothetical protein N2B02_04910, partial [Amylibacter sp.]